MASSLEGWATKAKEAPPHEVRLAPLDTNPVLQCLGEDALLNYNGEYKTRGIR